MKKRKKTRKILFLDILSKSRYWRYHLGKSTPAQEKLKLKKNEAIIDMSLFNLAKHVGRKLTEDEEIEVLTIVDKITPKRKDGNYMVDLLPFNYAWKIYEAKKDIGLDKFIGKLEVDIS